MNGAFQILRSHHVPLWLSGGLEHGRHGVAHQAWIFVLGRPVSGKAQGEETHQCRHPHIYHKAKDTLHRFVYLRRSVPLSGREGEGLSGLCCYVTLPWSPSSVPGNMAKGTHCLVPVIDAGAVEVGTMGVDPQARLG